MASISLTPEGFYRVRWRDTMGKSKQKNFKSKTEAKKYAAFLELNPTERSVKIQFSDYLEDYKKRFTSKKKGFREENLRINRFLATPLAKKPLGGITMRDIQNYIDTRSEEKSKQTGRKISPGTVIREMKTLSSVFNSAIKRGLIKTNPCNGTLKPKEPEHRWRIASDEDKERLLVASGWDGTSEPKTDPQWAVLMFFFACATGMRSGEILRIERTWIKGNTIRIPYEATKTDSRREIGLSTEALRLLDLAMKANPEEKIFGVMNDFDRDVEFRKVRDRADLGPVKDSEGRVIEEGLHFHDSRATFCTWAASPDPKTGVPRLDVLALARQTGHKDLKMLQRYYRASAEEIAKRLG